jgi:hypothetical protein
MLLLALQTQVAGAAVHMHQVDKALLVEQVL